MNVGGNEANKDATYKCVHTLIRYSVISENHTAFGTPLITLSSNFVDLNISFCVNNDLSYRVTDWVFCVSFWTASGTIRRRGHVRCVKISPRQRRADLDLGRKWPAGHFLSRLLATNSNTLKEFKKVPLPSPTVTNYQPPKACYSYSYWC